MSAQEPKAWTKFDELFDAPTNLEGANACYYARERLSRGGYSASQTNNLISNFTMEPHVRASNSKRWNHKIEAARIFAAELTRFLPMGMSATSIPTSKARSDPEFDPRFDMLFEQLRSMRPDLVFCEPVSRSQSVTAAHKADSRPSIEEILATLRYDGFKDAPPKHLIFIDDVVTTGKHFSACRRLLHREAPEVNCYGVFWAKTIWPEAQPSTPVAAISD